MIKIDLSFTVITYFKPIAKTELIYISKEEVSTIKVTGKKTIKQCKELIPTETIYICKEVVTETIEVSIDELLKIANKKENEEDEI